MIFKNGVYHSEPIDFRLLEAWAMTRWRYRFWKWVAMHLPSGTWGFRKVDEVLLELIDLGFAEMVMKAHEARASEPEEL